MAQLTIEITDELAARAQREAERRRTTLESLVTQYLAGLPAATPAMASSGVEQLLRTIRELSRPLGGKDWKNRDEFYER
jgi:hypothetical protein